MAAVDSEFAVVPTRLPLYLLAMQSGLAALVVIGATVLGIYGAMESDSLTAIYGAALGFAGGAASSLGALTTAVNGKATVSEATLRHAMDSPPNVATTPPPPGQVQT